MVAPVRRDVVMNMMHAPENLEASIMRVRRIVRCKRSFSKFEKGEIVRRSGFKRLR